MLEDLLDEKISPEVCRNVYGVVVVDGVLDLAATATRREELRVAAWLSFSSRSGHVLARNALRETRGDSVIPPSAKRLALRY